MSYRQDRQKKNTKKKKKRKSQSAAIARAARNPKVSCQKKSLVRLFFLCASISVGNAVERRVAARVSGRTDGYSCGCVGRAPRAVQNRRQPRAGAEHARTAPRQTRKASYPIGWYRLCATRDITAGQVKSLDCLGQRLVAFRGRVNGRVSVLDAHCTHMGAHMGTGRVNEDCLACPFHGWQFDRDGVCRKIPYDAFSVTLQNPRQIEDAIVAMCGNQRLGLPCGTRHRHWPPPRVHRAPARNRRRRRRRPTRMMDTTESTTGSTRSRVDPRARRVTERAEYRRRWRQRQRQAPTTATTPARIDPLGSQQSNT